MRLQYHLCSSSPLVGGNGPLGGGGGGGGICFFGTVEDPPLFVLIIGLSPGRNSPQLNLITGPGAINYARVTVALSEFKFKFNPG